MTTFIQNVKKKLINLEIIKEKDIYTLLHI